MLTDQRESLPSLLESQRIICKLVLGKHYKKLFLGIFWWLLFLAMKFTFLFLNLAKIQIFIPKSAHGGGGGEGGPPV